MQSKTEIVYKAVRCSERAHAPASAALDGGVRASGSGALQSWHAADTARGEPACAKLCRA